MVHIKKRILLVLMSFVLCFSSIPVNHKNVYAAEVVVGTTVTVGLMELILGTAITYDLVQKFEEVFGTPYKITFGGKPYDGILMTEEQIRAFDANNQAMEDKMTVLYEGSNIKVKYDGDETLYDGTKVDGEDMYFNPYFVNAMISANVWQKVLSVNESFKAMSISTLYGASIALKQDMTQHQKDMSKAIKQCMTMVATSLQSVAITMTPGLTEQDLEAHGIVSLWKNEFMNRAKNWIEQGYKYYVFADEVSYGRMVRHMIFFKNISRFEVGTGRVVLDFSNSEWTGMTYKDNKFESINKFYPVFDINKIYFYYTNYPTDVALANPFGIKEYPYDYITGNIKDGADNIGVIQNVVNGLLDVPADGIINQSIDVIRSKFGNVIDGQYENVIEVQLPQEYLENNAQFQLGVLEWLIRLYTPLNTMSETMVKGVTKGFTDTIDDYLTGEDEEGNKVYVPDVLGNIYGNLTDTSGILIGISDALNGIKEEVKEQTKATTNTASKALENELNTQIPNGGGGLFQLISSLVLILLLLLYLFLRCLQFIVLLFKVPASTAFLTPGMEQGLNWLKTTYLFGHSNPKLTFDAVSQSERIGLNISIWGFMIGTVNLLILFYILKRLRGYIERMK